VQKAFDEADVLGILPGHKRVERVNRLTSIYIKRLGERRAPAALTDSHFHHGILAELPKLLAGRRISVISCRDVKPVLEGEWGLDDIAVYQVPSQHALREVDGRYEAALHGIPIWPDVHARLHDELTVRESGEVFLVGAGMFGKDLCIRIREAGGLALDLGSALDRIAGKITRGSKRGVLLLHRQGMSVDEIAETMENRHGIEVDREKIRKLTREERPLSVENPFNPTWMSA
jgi:hypothetical protein